MNNIIMKEYKMPYKGFDINKDEERGWDIEKALDRQLNSILNAVKYVQDNFSDSDYKYFMKMVEEELGFD